MRRVSLLCPLLILVLQSWAQTKTVTGTVNDDKGQPVAAASVLGKGTKTGTATDATGAFKINLPTDVNTLVISFVGFQTLEVDITNKPTVTVALVPQSTALTDIVVIGYGTARRKDVTGSISSVQAKDFNKGTITSPDQLLQNKVPGLEVTQNSGQPGAATTVKIRGNNSIRGGNNPIYVVDGVILDGRTARPDVSFGQLGSSTPQSNPLTYINPNDIASIDILKDASSSAIYGSRGANGVVVITTKKGAAGPTKLEVGTSFGVFAGYMKKYEILDAGEFRSGLTKYNASSDFDGKQNIDAQDEIKSDKLSQNYSLAFSGGNETGRFRASFLGSSTQGFVKNTSLDRYLGNLGGTYKFLDKKLTIDFDLIAGHTKEKIGAVTNNAGSEGNLISAVLEWNPTQPFTDPATGFYVFPGNGSGNPMALIAGLDDIADVNTFLGNISASYQIIKGLQYKFLYAINHSAGTRNTNEYGWLQGYPNLSGLGYGAVSHAVLTSQTFTHTLNYIADITKNLNLNATAGFEYWKSDFSHNTFSARGFNTNLSQSNLVDIKYTDIMQNGSTQALPTITVDPTNELQSYFVRAILNYSDRFFVTGTFRADGSSKFGSNNRYGYFPSVAGKWLISNESFMKGGLFSSLALRASWGKTGNQEFPPGSSQEQFGFTSYNNAGQINVANPDLRWETTTSYDFGLDYSLLKGRIYGAFDYYNKTTTDILFQSIAIQPAPASQYWINIPGDLKNTGYEFAIGATIIQEKDFTWDLSFNIANNKNKLTNFYSPGTKTPIVILTGEISGQGVSGTLSQVITNDQPVNEFYLKPFKGFDSAGSQIVGSPDEVNFAGDPNPHTIYGVSTTLRYKKFALSLNAGGAGGFLIYSNTRTNITNISGISNGRNIDKEAYNSQEQPSSGAAVSTRFLEDGDYFKLRNASINYNLGNIGSYIKGLNIFVSGSNLFVLTKFTGFDPEVNIDKSGTTGYPSRSIEYVPYPTPRIISFGLNFSL